MPGRPGCVAHLPDGRSCVLAWARVPAWGLPPGGPGGRLGLMSGGLASGRGSSLGLEFLEAVAVHLLLAENYNRTTTDHTTEAQSAQRLTSEVSGPSPV